MTYSILDSELKTASGKFRTLSAATKKAIETKPQGKVWFIEEESGDIVALVHCDSVWIPLTQAEIEEKDRQGG